MQLEKNLKIVVELYKIKYEKKIINKKTVDIKKIFFLLLKISINLFNLFSLFNRFLFSPKVFIKPLLLPIDINLQ